MGLLFILWQIAHIIIIQKPGKSVELIESYRPISLLPILETISEIPTLKNLHNNGKLWTDFRSIRLPK